MHQALPYVVAYGGGLERFVQHKIMGNRSGPAYLRFMAGHLNRGSKCEVSFDNNDRVTHFSFMTSEQLTLFQCFPHFLGIDSTYGTCRERLNMFLFVAIDSLGVGIPIFLMDYQRNNCLHILCVETVLNIRW